MSTKTSAKAKADDKATKTPEQKRADFERLATGRVNKALDAIRGLSHLANKAAYDYESSHVAKLSNAITNAHDNMVKSFEAGGTKTTTKKDFF